MLNSISCRNLKENMKSHLENEEERERKKESERGVGGGVLSCAVENHNVEMV